MNDFKIILVSLLLFVAGSSWAQVAINTDGSQAKASAILDVSSTSLGVLMPRMTTAEMQAVSDTANGLMAFNTTENKLYIYVAGNNEWKPVAYTWDIVSSSGRVWMDRNLGTSKIATSKTDAAAYGDLYQWGRFTDGHEKRNSSVTTTLASTAVPNAGNSWDGKFIKSTSSPYDWLSPQNNNLWQGVDGVNNPCPPGFRLPTIAELNSERIGWSSNNANGAYSSALKLTVAGRRRTNGNLNGVGTDGYYWSLTADGNRADALHFNNSTASTGVRYRALGASVRCVKE